MKYYWTVWKACVRSALIREMEFRANFIVNIFLGLVWIAYSLAIVEVIFYNTHTLAGWTHAEALMLMGFWLFLDKTVSVVAGQGLRRIPFDVADGRFDFVLIRPLSAQFFASFRFFDFKDMSDAIIGIGIMLYAYVVGAFHASWQSLLAAGVLALCSFLLTYAFWLSFEVLSMWFFKIDNIENLFRSVVRLGRYPTDVFPRSIRTIAVTIIPIAVLTNFPVRALFGDLAMSWVLYTVGFTCVIMYCTRKFWLLALHHYSSASS